MFTIKCEKIENRKYLNIFFIDKDIKSRPFGLENISQTRRGILGNKIEKMMKRHKQISFGFLPWVLAYKSGQNCRSNSHFIVIFNLILNFLNYLFYNFGPKFQEAIIKFSNFKIPMILIFIY